MKTRPVKNLILVLLFTSLNVSVCSAQDGKIHALLVGVTKYPELVISQQLDGPINDVKLVETTLEQRFGSRQNGLADNIVSLHEDQPDNLKPTYANIEREFVALAERVNQGDQVFVLLSGHGSQDLDDADESSADYEPDGLDEVFLPRDVKGWNEEKNMVEGGIRDDQINDWLNAIQAKGATVVFVSDSCHSNTQTRGANDSSFKSRRVDLVPKWILEQRVTRRSRGGSTESLPFDAAPKASRIGFFAAQTDETTPDSFRLPETKSDTKNGLLVYTLCRVLRESQGPITYRELGQLIHKKYQFYRNVQIGTDVPTPAMSGTDLDRVFLGNQWQVGRSRLAFEVRGDVIEISGGSIDGITVGTILQLFPLAGASNANQAQGFVRIDSVDVRQSFGTFVDVDEDGKCEPSDVPSSLTAGRCEMYRKNYGRVQITVGLDSTFDAFPDARQQIALLGQKDTSPFQIVDDASRSEFVLSVEKYGGTDRVILSRPDKELATVADFDLGTVDNDTPNRVEAAFKRIWRAKSLTDLATRMPSFNAEGTQYGGNVSVEVVAEMGVKNEQGNWVFSPVDLAAGESLQVDAQVRFRVRNHSKSEVNVTLLYISDSYEIVSLMPSDVIKSNTIAADHEGKYGESPLIGPFPVKAHSRILENIIVIATRANETMSAKSDYTYLAQPQLNAVWENGGMQGNALLSAWGQTRSRSADSQQISPLDQLLDVSGFNASKSRSLGGAIVKDHSIGIVTWKSARVEQEFPKAGLATAMENQFFQIDTRPWPDAPSASRSKTRGVGQSVYPKVAPAIVVVRTEGGHGTGFLISEDGWVLTNHHVVAGATINRSTGARSAKVYLGRMVDGWMKLIDEPVVAEVYKWDEEADLALLKLSETPDGFDKFPTIQFAASTPGPGSDCIAIGHPSSGTLWTLRTGDVAGVAIWPHESFNYMMQRMSLSASSRGELEEFLTSQPKTKVLYSTCGINPGDSGGPLLNKDGELIAVTFAIPSEVRDDKFSFHIHLSEVQKFIEDKPSSPLVEAILVDEDWSEFEVADLTSDKSADTVMLESESSLGFLVDLDQDSNENRVRKAESYDEIKQNWDAEFVVYVRNSALECLYDTDNDGELDLWLIDSDEDPEAEMVWVRKNGDWTVGSKKEFGMFDVEHFESNKKKLSKPFRQTSRGIINFLTE